jgi:hypothetical protein
MRNFASTCSSSATSRHTSPEFQPIDTNNAVQRISFISETEYREMTPEELELEDSFCSTNSDRIVADLDELYVERLFQISPDSTEEDRIMESDPGFAFPKLNLSPIKFVTIRKFENRFNTSFWVGYFIKLLQN